MERWTDEPMNRFFAILGGPGEVSEWLKEHAWKACVPKRYRGFESPPLRHDSDLPKALKTELWPTVGVSTGRTQFLREVASVTSALRRD
jgi:hypothetical protein